MLPHWLCLYVPILLKYCPSFFPLVTLVFHKKQFFCAMNLSILRCIYCTWLLNLSADMIRFIFFLGWYKVKINDASDTKLWSDQSYIVPILDILYIYLTRVDSWDKRKGMRYFREYWPFLFTFSFLCHCHKMITRTWYSPRCPLRSHSLLCIESRLFIVGIGPILNKELKFIFRSEFSDCMYVYS